MAVSPLVAQPTDVLQAPSPLKRQASAVPSSNGTPHLARPPGHDIQQGLMTLDLVEQMNEDEKRKYVKGQYTSILSL